jgi:[acyl-carrier-protein] S-malonyltransferase
LKSRKKRRNKQAGREKSRPVLDAMIPPASQTVFLFPGQGSQLVGMGRELAAAFPAAQQIFMEADDILGFHLSRIAWEGPEIDLNDTINTQPALLVQSTAVLHVFQQLYPGFKPAYTAGHSMGELSALIVAGALPFADALRLVRRRGELMKQAGMLSPGGMAAIMGLEIPVLDQLCNQASRPDAQPAEIVQVANDNCPGQVVISGSSQALVRALELAQQAGARRAIPLAVSIAAHSPLMSMAQTSFNQAVADAPITKAVVPLVGNVTASPLIQADQVRADLQAQLTHRVRWTETIQFMISQGITTFIEMGNGTVLTGLLKRINRDATGINLGTPDDFAKLAN